MLDLRLSAAPDLGWRILLLAGGVIHDLRRCMFGLSPHDRNVIHYSGIAFVTLYVILFFFFPWLLIRLVLRKLK